MAQNNLTVRVTNQENSPLSGATVTLNQQTTQSNSEGLASFSDLSNQNYLLQVTFLGYSPQKVKVNPSRQKEIHIRLTELDFQAEEIYINVTRAKENSATTFKNLGKEEIQRKNVGQDIPYLLDQTPGVVIGSDAGAGIGYTNMTIRGSDNERINVTLNGIPLNNSESMGSFFVNLPDFASSTQSIQVQRGIGTSTNGAGAFGASLNIQTDALESSPYAELNNSFGSFNSWKNTVKAGSGLINGKYAVNARLSRISSDGYVERGSSDLKSFYVDAGMFTDKHTLKATVFSGKEKTYQAWYGLPEPLYTGNRDRLDDYIAAMEIYDPTEIERIKNADRRYNIYNYDNQTDNYTQTHSHLQYTYKISDKTSLNAGLHYTRGAGYYEEYRIDDKFSNYGLTDIINGTETIKKTDLIRQRWLDNWFYGVTYALQHRVNNHFNLSFGGAYNQYVGGHFGEVIWSKYNWGTQPNHRYYYNEAHKNDFNFFAKADYRLNKWLFNVDLQYRNIYYNAEGDDNKIKNFHFNDKLNFFNPKAGFTYLLNDQSNIYASYAYASKEPVRDDYLENPLNLFPKPEKMQDIEAGYRYRDRQFNIGANLYAMLYKDQLIPTGKINNVGEAIRQNVKDSYRIGFELDAAWKVSNLFQWSMTAALSQNKIKNFTELMTIYNNNIDWEYIGEKEIFHKSTNIAKSPSAVLSNNFTFHATPDLSFSLLSKYISRIYMDNTSAKERSLKPSFVNHFQAVYNFSAFGIANIGLNATVYNILNTKYATSGYTWGQYFQDSNQRDYYNFYYPQAGTNFMLGLNIRF
ncbi:TonB-dependent receptor [Sphingobacterium kyonggiense]|uniref:TonB-dependent receptor n=2 Tax=Sphingobacterium kyonggiense TaxID=714075 RepID=A0ABP7Z303_9SPHI